MNEADREMEVNPLTDQLITQAMASLIRDTLPIWPEPRTSVETKFVFELDGVDYFVTLTIQLGEAK